MRIVLVCDWFLKYAAMQASALARAGAEVELVCRTHALEFDGDEHERRAVLEALDGVDVREVPGRMSSPASLGFVARLAKNVRRWKPDIVHAHDNSDPRLLAIVAGLPRIVTVHDPVPHPGQPRLRRVEALVRRRWIRGAAALVVHGDALRVELPSWMQRRSIWSIPHGTAVADTPLLPPPTPTVLLFGRLEPYKGVDVLARAMGHVWAARPETRLLVAGVGSSVRDVPSDPRVELRNEYIPESEVPALLGAVSLVVLPYVQASQSGVGALALGHGVPTVVSDVGALHELALDESFLVPAQNEAALGAAILAHLDDGAEVRARVLEFARARLSWDACAARSLHLYECVAGQP